MKRVVVLLCVALLGMTACAGNNGSSSNGSSSNGSSNSNGGSSNNSNGSSNNNGGSSNNSNGSSNNNGGSSSSNNNGGSSNDGGSSNGGSSSGGDNGKPSTNSPGTVPSSDVGTPSTVPPNFTTPQPDANGNVKVPDAPPKEIADKSPRNRLSSLPPVPRGCLDDDLTLLDVFAPFVSVPVRLTYCLLYVGTIARLPSEINVRINAPSLNGPTLNIPLLAPDHTQRPLATGALIILIVVVAIVIGYTVGRRRGQQSQE